MRFDVGRVKATYSKFMWSIQMCLVSSLYWGAKSESLMSVHRVTGRQGISLKSVPSVPIQCVEEFFSSKGQLAKGMMTEWNSSPLALWMVMQTIPSACAAGMAFSERLSSQSFRNSLKVPFVPAAYVRKMSKKPCIQASCPSISLMSSTSYSL